MNNQKNTAGHLVVWGFLIGILFPLNVLSATLHKQIAADPDSITLQPHELFWRKSINGAGGIYEFVNSTFYKEQGIANVDKARLPSGQVFIFNEIRIGLTTGANVNLAGKALYNTPPTADIRNAEVEIQQENRTVLNMPFASLCNGYTGNSTDDDFVKLGSLLYLRDDVEFKISFKFPSGVSIPAGGGASDNSYAEVRLRGHHTTRKY